MATWLYKGDKKELVDPLHVDSLLKDGWTVEEVKKPVKKVKKDVPKD